MSPFRWCADDAARLTCRHAAGSASLALMLPLLGLVADPTQACATCGCTLSADAAMGYSASAGWRVNDEYDYLNQDQLRSGTHRFRVYRMAPNWSTRRSTATSPPG